MARQDAMRSRQVAQDVASRCCALHPEHAFGNAAGPPGRSGLARGGAEACAQGRLTNLSVNKMGPSDKQACRTSVGPPRTPGPANRDAEAYGRPLSACRESKAPHHSRDSGASQHKDVILRSKRKTIQHAHNSTFEARQRSCLDTAGVTGGRRRDSLHGRVLGIRKSTADMQTQHAMKEETQTQTRTAPRSHCP